MYVLYLVSRECINLQRGEEVVGTVESRWKSVLEIDDISISNMLSFYGINALLNEFFWIIFVLEYIINLIMSRTSSFVKEILKIF